MGREEEQASVLSQIPGGHTLLLAPGGCLTSDTGPLPLRGLRSLDRPNSGIFSTYSPLPQCGQSSRERDV